MAKKTFDCVQMKRDAQDALALRTQGMSPAQRDEYIRAQAAAFLRRLSETGDQQGFRTLAEEFEKTPQKTSAA